MPTLMKLLPACAGSAYFVPLAQRIVSRRVFFAHLIPFLDRVTAQGR